MRLILLSRSIDLTEVTIGVYCTVVTIGSLSYSLQLNKPAELTYHHSLFTFQPAREAGPIGLFALALHAKPNLAVRTLAVPTKVAVRDRIY